MLIESIDKLSSNLKKLLAVRDIAISQLAKELNRPQPTISRIVHGQTQRPKSKIIKQMAAFFKVPEEELIGEKEIEWGNVDGWINTIINKKFVEIPLIEWEDLSHLNEIESHKTIAILNDLSAECFAISMNDSSMEPQFAKGDILIFDPNKKPFDRSYVLIRLGKAGPFIFRQLIIDATHRFLKPLNPDLANFEMRLLEESNCIIGMLVEARQLYNK